MAALACLGLGSSAGNGMASTKVSSELASEVMVDSPYQQGAPDDRNFLQVPALIESIARREGSCSPRSQKRDLGHPFFIG
jgi:hypothetical protein